MIVPCVKRGTKRSSVQRTLESGQQALTFILLVECWETEGRNRPRGQWWSRQHLVQNKLLFSSTGISVLRIWAACTSSMTLMQSVCKVAQVSRCPFLSVCLFPSLHPEFIKRWFERSVHTCSFAVWGLFLLGLSRPTAWTECF